MKKIFFIFFCILVLAVLCQSQEIIENSKNPLSKKAGRVIGLKEILNISDEGEAYYFKYPNKLRIAPDGSIFVLDWMSDQLLQFDGNGKFLRNFFKKGQGPGELSSVRDFLFDVKNIIVYDAQLQKILWLDFNGEAVKEFKVKRERSSDFVLHHKENYYFIQSNSPVWKGGPDYVDIHYYLTYISQEKYEHQELMSFSLKAYTIPGKSGGYGGWFNIEKMINAPLENRYLFISHSQEYLIKMFDAETNKIICAFRREYKRVKPSSEYKETMKKGGVGIDGKRYTEPEQKYRNDIQNLLVNGSQLWVMTSTEDKKKGLLVDVFDLEAKYIDQFYLKFTEKNFPRYGGLDKMAFWGEFLYQIETTPEETYVIKKYRMEDTN